MDELHPVTFRFGGEYEVHYLPRIPEIGDRVTHRGAFWVVSSIDEDATGTVARCELSVRNGGSNGPSLFGNALTR